MDSIQHQVWEPQGPAPEPLNNGFRRQIWVISSCELANWLGYDQLTMAATVSWWYAFQMTNKQARGIKHRTTIYRENGENYPVFKLDHRAALRLCKSLDRNAVPALHGIFAQCRKFAALPGLAVGEIEYETCIRYVVDNAAYHGADRIMRAFGHDLACDADRYFDKFTANRPMSAQMVGETLEIRIHNARDFSQHKERSLLQLKRLIRSALSIYLLGGVAA